MSQKPNIEICLTPLLLPLFQLKEKNVVVIDIFRATTTITWALHNGADAVIPVEKLEDCQQYQHSNYLLAAERNGQRAEGFDLGNSPFDYPKEVVDGKTVVLTTTNGTRAVEMSRSAQNVLCGSFLSITALADWLRKEQRDTLLLCAGWKHHISFEDSLFAGALVDMLKHDFEFELDATFGTQQLFANSDGHLSQLVRHSSHFKRLSGYGVHRDIEFCIQTDQTEVIPVLSKGKLLPLDHS